MKRGEVLIVGAGIGGLSASIALRGQGFGVTIEYGATISDLRDEGNHVDVTCADGSRRTADLVVGADGVRSVVRRFVLADGLEPRYNGQSAFRVNIPREPEIDQIVLRAGPTGMAGFVPIGQDLAYLFLNIPWGPLTATQPGRAAGGAAGEAGAVRRPDRADPRHVHRRPGGHRLPS